MTVRVHHRHQHVHEFSLTMRPLEFFHDGSEMLGGESVQQVAHCRPFLLFEPHALEWSKQRLVELRHDAEAGAFVEEVELFVVLIWHFFLVRFLLLLLGEAVGWLDISLALDLDLLLDLRGHVSPLVDGLRPCHDFAIIRARLGRLILGIIIVVFLHVSFLRRHW